MLRWPHGGHVDCASARAGSGVRRWARPAGARDGGRFTALQRARGRAEERTFAATTTFLTTARERKRRRMDESSSSFKATLSHSQPWFSIGSVPLCQDSCLLNYAALLRQRRRRWAACVASHVPTLGRWRAGPASSAMHPGLPRRPQLAKIVAIIRRGRSGWRMRQCERTKSERASWPGLLPGSMPGARQEA